MHTNGKIKWGILGTGWIADKFCTALTACEDAEIYAVGSRTQETANQFAKRFSILRHTLLMKLLSRPGCRCHLHRYTSSAPLRKCPALFTTWQAVLNEKAFTVNAKQAREIKALAEEKNLFVMEAFWPRFQPVNREVYRLVNEDHLIGDIK